MGGNTPGPGAAGVAGDSGYFCAGGDGDGGGNLPPQHNAGPGAAGVAGNSTHNVRDPTPPPPTYFGGDNAETGAVGFPLPTDWGMPPPYTGHVSNDQLPKGYTHSQMSPLNSYTFQTSYLDLNSNICMTEEDGLAIWDSLEDW